MLKLLKANTPVRHLISRHTRRHLRRYHQAGKITTPIAERHVEDRFVQLSAEESRVYAEVEDYIASTYNNTEKERKTAVGFVMTIYRRRLASSFHALARTLQTRLDALRAGQGALLDKGRLEEDLPDDEAAEEVMDAEDAEKRSPASISMRSPREPLRNSRGRPRLTVWSSWGEFLPSRPSCRPERR